MFRGDPRRPWIDIGSEKIVQRHLSMVAIQVYLREKSNSMDAIPAVDFLDNHLLSFNGFLSTFEIQRNDNLVPKGSSQALNSYKNELTAALSSLKKKRDDHPELFVTDDSNDNGCKSLLDALYEEGIIPTYSFPKNVVSTYISDNYGKVKYQVERGLDVAIGEYAPAELSLWIKRLTKLVASIIPVENAAYRPPHLPPDHSSMMPVTEKRSLPAHNADGSV